MKTLIIIHGCVRFTTIVMFVNLGIGVSTIDKYDRVGIVCLGTRKGNLNVQ